MTERQLHDIMVDDDSKVTLTIRWLFGILGLTIAGTVGVCAFQFQISAKLEEQNRVLTALVDQVVTLKSETYTTAHASENAMRMAIENPNLRVPDPRNPGQILRVYQP